MRLWTVETACTLGIHCRAVSTSNDWAGVRKVLECWEGRGLSSGLFSRAVSTEAKQYPLLVVAAKMIPAGPLFHSPDRGQGCESPNFTSSLPKAGFCPGVHAGANLTR